ncbi:lipopolysaccharide biosynthesis protein [Thermoleophilia bacterium SCSIO 60948]|nr:lipopolysaccharide biosynthesis protein [Thermoleophilia bacterium SCSIO 60948]
MSAEGRQGGRGGAVDPLPPGSAGEVYLRVASRPKQRRRPKPAPEPIAAEQKVATNPGGSAALLGVKAVRLSGVHGLATLWNALAQMGTLFAIALFLGPSELGRYGLLFFLAMMLGQLLAIACKPGIIRRVFGGSDDDDGGDDEDDDASDVADSPVRTLGVGLIWAAFLGVIGTAVVVVLREPIAEILLNDPQDANLIVWAGILGGATAFIRTASIVLWFEHRPVAFLVAEGSRPVLAFGGTLALLIAGEGLAGAIAGAAIGTLIGALLDVVLLRGSFELAFDPRETLRIVVRGAPRVPIITSLWAIQNADVFILSRFVDDASLGVYLLASRLGFIASFAPQGLRMAMRPLRRASVFEAAKDQYGKATQRGEYLAYFVMLCISTVLATTLVGELLVQIVPETFGEAGGLIPATAIGIIGPALLRTVNQSSSWPGKTRRVFITCVVGAAFAFVGVTIATVGALGVYAAPVGLVVAFGVPSLGIFLRGQFGPDPIAFPYSWVARTAACALFCGGLFYVLPTVPEVFEVLIAIGLGILYLVLLIVTGAIPEKHRRPLLHVIRSLGSGRADTTDLHAGIATLGPTERDALREAVERRIPVPELTAGEDAERAERNAHLVALLRRAGRAGGASIDGASRLDAQIAEFVFADSPRAVRDQSMRRLFSEGADSHDIRALEDLVADLAARPRVWDVSEEVPVATAGDAESAPERAGEPVAASGPVTGEAGEEESAAPAPALAEPIAGPAAIVFLTGADTTGPALVGALLEHHSVYALIARGAALDAVLDGVAELTAGDIDAPGLARRLGEIRAGEAGDPFHRLVPELRMRAALERLAGASAASPQEAARDLLLDLVWTIASEYGKPGLLIDASGSRIGPRELLAVVPGARIVHVLRDGRDLAASDDDGAPPPPPGAARNGAVSVPERRVEAWEGRLRSLEHELVAADSDRTVTISLDELIRTRRRIIYAKLIDFLELEDEMPMKRYFKGRLTDEEAGSGRWREHVAPEEREAVERRYEDALEAMGAEELKAAKILRRVAEHDAGGGAND